MDKLVVALPPLQLKTSEPKLAWSRRANTGICAKAYGPRSSWSIESLRVRWGDATETHIAWDEVERLLAGAVYPSVASLGQCRSGPHSKLE